MTGRASEPYGKAVTRRRCILISAGLVGSTAGCAGEDSDSGPVQRDGNPDSTPSNNNSRQPNIQEEIENLYSRIAAIPLADDGEFVYDVERALDNLDYEELVQDAQDVFEAAKGLDDEFAGKYNQENWVASGRLAFLLADQRLLVHQSLVAALIYRRHFANGNYLKAVKAMTEAANLMEKLRANGGDILSVLETDATCLFPIDGYRARSIRSDLDVLYEVLRWINPVYDGFEQAARGMVSIQYGNRNLKEENYESVRNHFDDGQDYFENAKFAFDAAHGTGQAVEIIEPIVEDLRCLLPTLTSGYEDLEEAIDNLEKGNKEEGQKLAEATLTEMGEGFNQCL